MKIKSLIFLLLLFVSSLQVKAQTIITSEEALEDLDFLVKTIEEVHYNPYMNISQEDWQKEIVKYQQKYQNLESLKVLDFSIDMQKLITNLDDVNSMVGFPNDQILKDAKSYQFFPFKIQINSQLEAEIYDETSDKGIILQSINGQNSVELYEECLTLLRGTVQFRSFYCSNYYFPLFLFHKGIRPPFELTLKNQEGMIKTVKLSNQQVINIDELIKRIVYDWSEKPYNLVLLKNNTVAYIDFSRYESYENFVLFLDSSFQVIEEQEIDKLIIDIRDNSVYNTTISDRFNDLLLSYLTRKKYRKLSERNWKVSQVLKNNLTSPLYKDNLKKKFIKKCLKAANGTYFQEEITPIKPKKPKYFFKGKTCVLINTGTFNSTKLLADALKTYQIAILIGQATGQRSNGFDQSINFHMPNSQLIFGCSVVYQIGANGNKENKEPIKPNIEVKGDALDFAIKWLEEK